MRAFRDLLATQTLSDTFLSALVPKIVAELLSLPERETSQKIAGQLRETLNVVAPGEARRNRYDTVRDLLNHSLSEVQALGGQIVLNNLARRTTFLTTFSTHCLRLKPRTFE